MWEGVSSHKRRLVTYRGIDQINIVRIIGSELLIVGEKIGTNIERGRTRRTVWC